MAGYEDVNDAERLSLDPTFRLIGSRKNWERGAEIAGLNLMTLGSMKGLKVSQHQQWVLLAGLGVEVDAD